MRTIHELYSDIASVATLKEHISGMESRISQLEKEAAELPSEVESVIASWKKKIEPLCVADLTKSIKYEYSECDKAIRWGEKHRQIAKELDVANELHEDYKKLVEEYREKRMAAFDGPLARFEQLRQKCSRATDPLPVLFNLVFEKIIPSKERGGDLSYEATWAAKTYNYFMASTNAKLKDHWSGFHLDWDFYIKAASEKVSVFKKLAFRGAECRSLMKEIDDVMEAFKRCIPQEEKVLEEEVKAIDSLTEIFELRVPYLLELMDRWNKEVDDEKRKEAERLNREFDESLAEWAEKFRRENGRRPDKGDVAFREVEMGLYGCERGYYVAGAYKVYGGLEDIKPLMDAFKHYHPQGLADIKGAIQYADKTYEHYRSNACAKLRCFTDNESQVEEWFRKRQLPSSGHLRAGDPPLIIDYGTVYVTSYDMGRLKSLCESVPIDEDVFKDLYKKNGSVARFERTLRSVGEKALAIKKEKTSTLRQKKEEALRELERKEPVVKELRQSRQVDPVVLGVPSGRYNQESAAALCRAIEVAAQERFSLPCFVNPFKESTEVPGMPEIIRWHGSNLPGNFLFTYAKGEKEKVAESMNNVLLTILLAFKIKDVKLTFIDPLTSNDGSFFTTRLGTRVCSVVNRDSDIRQLIERWQSRASMVGSHCSDIVPYNNANRTVLAPYEVAVILGKPTPALESMLTPFIENGGKYGLSFVSLLPEGTDPACRSAYRVLKRSGSIPSGPEGEGVMPLTADRTLLDTLFAYIDARARREEAVQAISQSVDEFSERPYQDAVGDFSVPVGEHNGREVCFRLSNQHIHSFVIGQTGQGKSVLLHDVIAGSILNYSPEDYQVYLLDFKMSGEELYHYKDVPHVRALLASGSDLRITYEVLRDLRDQMQRRSDLMREASARTLEEYNGEASEKIPRILLVVDECQELFRDNTHRQQGDASIMIDIRSIIEDVARKGRSQGVHLLFATQTLSGTQLPSVIKNNITDHFLFKCAPEDAEQLVPGSSRKVQQLTVGNVLLSNTDGETLFQAYLPDVDEMVDEALRKASGIQSGKDRFIFSGQSEHALGMAEKEQLTLTRTTALRFLLGRGADVQQEDIGERLIGDMGENLLFVGYNPSQVSRASFSALLTLMAVNKAWNLGYTFYCLDLLHSEEEAVSRPLEAMRERGLKMVPQSRAGEVLEEIASKVRADEQQKTVLFIFGQERFKAVRDEYEMPTQESPSQEALPRTFGRPQARTYRSELRFILERGPETGVHCLLQVDRISNLLFENTLMSKNIYRMFNYICLLRTEKEAEIRLNTEGLYPHQLSDDERNLGAWFINDREVRKYKFTPYKRIDEDTVKLMLD